MRCLLWLPVLLLLALPASCRDEPEREEATSAGAPRRLPKLGKAARPEPGARACPAALEIESWPDLAKPGGQVTMRVHPVPDDAPLDKLDIGLKADPCGGSLEQTGAEAVYKVPLNCKGGRILIFVTAAEPGCEKVEKEFSFRVAGDMVDSGALLLWPSDKTSVTAPLQVAWDRTLVRKENLSLRIKVERRNQTIARLDAVQGEDVVEINVPPSPEPTYVEMCAGADTCQKVRLNVFRHQGVQLPSLALLVDDYSREGENSSGGILRPLDGSERIRWRPGRIVGTDAALQTRFLAVRYRRSPTAARQGLEWTLGQGGRGMRVAGYPTLSVWLRPGPLNRMPGPLMMELTSRSGRTWTKRIFHRGARWEEHKIDVSRFTEGYRVATRLALYVDEERVVIPAGTINLGPIAFLPPERAVARPAQFDDDVVEEDAR